MSTPVKYSPPNFNQAMEDIRAAQFAQQGGLLKPDDPLAFSVDRQALMAKPIPPPKEKDRLLFIMPTDLETFLIAMANIQFLLKYTEETRKAVGFTYEYDLRLVCLPEFVFLTKAIREAQLVTPYDVETATRHDYDLVVNLNQVELFRDIASCTGQHLSQALGITMGADIAPFPDLTLITPKVETEKKVLIVPWRSLGYDDVGTLQRYFETNYPEYTVENMLPEKSYEDDFLRIVHARGVIAPRGYYTLMAASLGKKVIEVYNDDVPRSWLSKFGARQYRMIYGESVNVTPQLVWRAVEQLYGTSSV